ncbi:hypothetical protein [Halostagnicola sp. A56]|uniref:hypothetical protein n=1 Tax=Halostagnicola sp. A56 TaxID=1495067 RepID=UPI0012E1CDCC|nr:hypothetical protein [Halostagnicola sp. A56]
MLEFALDIIKTFLEGCKTLGKVVWKLFGRCGGVYRRFKATASGLDPEGEADNFPVF